MTMEDHIIDRIIDFLKIDDCKSFSETCNKFNELFSKSKHIDRFWLNLKHVEALTVETLEESPRVNKNVIWHEEVPTSIIEFLSPNLKRLKLTITRITPEFPRDINQFLVEFLPHLANLTHFEVKAKSKYNEGSVVEKNIKESLKVLNLDVGTDFFNKPIVLRVFTWYSAWSENMFDQWHNKTINYDTHWKRTSIDEICELIAEHAIPGFNFSADELQVPSQ